MTGLHRSGKVQRVAASFSSVVEHHTCRDSRKKACEESETFALLSSGLHELSKNSMFYNFISILELPFTTTSFKENKNCICMKNNLSPSKA